MTTYAQFLELTHDPDFTSVLVVQQDMDAHTSSAGFNEINETRESSICKFEQRGYWEGKFVDTSSNGKSKDECDEEDIDWNSEFRKRGKYLIHRSYLLSVQSHKRACDTY